MSEIKPINYADYAFGGNIAVADQMATAMGELTQNRVGSSLARGFGRIGGAFYLVDSVFDRNLQNDSGKNRYLVPFSCRAAIRYKLRGIEEGYSNAVETADPPSVFGEWKGEQSWVEWLGKSRRKGGPTRAQFNEVLNWNLDAMVAVNTERAGELAGQTGTYLSKAQTAVEEGRLPPTFLQKAAEVLPRTQLIIVDPLNIKFDGGSSHAQENVLLLARNYDHALVVHEQTHQIGGFEGKLLNEVGTEMITSEMVPGTVPEEELSMYVFMERVVRSALDTAGVTTKEIADIYIGPNEKDNTHALYKLVEERTGEDKLRELDVRFRKLRKFWTPRVLFNRDASAMVSGIILLKELEPDLSYGEIIRRDLPSTSAQKIEQLETMIEVLSSPLSTIAMDIFRARKEE
jgi:hypothetical protein